MDVVPLKKFLRVNFEFMVLRFRGCDSEDTSSIAPLLKIDILETCLLKHSTWLAAGRGCLRKCAHCQSETRRAACSRENAPWGSCEIPSMPARASGQCTTTFNLRHHDFNVTIKLQDRTEETNCQLLPALDKIYNARRSSTITLSLLFCYSLMTTFDRIRCNPFKNTCTTVPLQYKGRILTYSPTIFVHNLRPRQKIWPRIVSLKFGCNTELPWDECNNGSNTTVVSEIPTNFCRLYQLHAWLHRFSPPVWSA